WKARAYLLKRKQDLLVKQLLEAGGDAASANDDKDFKALASSLKTSDILLDGVLGTGTKLPLKEEIGNVLAETIYVMADLDDPPLVVAVDCPSGVDCDTGEVADECIPADLTVTMAAVKQGLLKLPAFEYVGELKVIDIGLPEVLPALRSVQVEVAEQDMVSALLPDRPADAHKGTFGAAMIAAGSVNYTGAVLLAGQAAYRIGAGLVTLAVPAPLHTALAGQFPEATWVLLPHAQGVIAKEGAEVIAKNLERATALLIGPGLGLEDTTKEFIQQLLTGKSISRKSGSRIGFVHGEEERGVENSSQLPPLVFDADGLKLLAKINDWPNLVPAAAILTPHPGEMAVLTGSSKEDIQENRQAMAAKCAAQWGHVVVLKGAFTIVPAPDGRITVIP
ncbi:MAG: bifunctional ADP-dependent NAD(P)H-hydrate dehydratase/NAD(P)H-hydrate epimerase, partial [Gammaproteobacteria bacterium]